MAKADRNLKIVAVNRKARRNYEIEDTIEAGIALQGSEVKSLRNGQANIAEAYAAAQDSELFLINSYIPEYAQASRSNHEPRQSRKLLLRRKEIDKLVSAVERDGMTLVPLRLYFNERGIAKLELALARGKKLHDKRETERKRDWERQKARLMREKG